MSISTAHSAARKRVRSAQILKAFDADFQAKIDFGIAQRGKQEAFIAGRSSATTASSGKENRIIERYMLNEAEYLRTFGIY